MEDCEYNYKHIGNPGYYDFKDMRGSCVCKERQNEETEAVRANK